MENSNLGKYSSEDTSSMRELRAHLYRIQKLVLSLLQKFQIPTGANCFATVQIAANILLYARNQMQHNRIDQKLRNVLFEPFLSQISDNFDYRNRETSSGMHLGIVVDHLIASTNLVHNESLVRRPTSVKEMSSTDLKQVINFFFFFFFF